MTDDLEKIATPSTAMVHIAENNRVLSSRLAELLSSCGLAVFQSYNAHQCLGGLKFSTPDLLIVGLDLHHGGALEFLNDGILREIPTIVLAAEGMRDGVSKARKLGAIEAITIPVDPIATLNKVHKVLSLTGAARHLGPSTRPHRSGFAALTPRERQILLMITFGHSNKSVARELGLSPRTVEVHRSNLMHKVGAKNAAELVRMALETGPTSIGPY